MPVIYFKKIALLLIVLFKLLSPKNIILAAVAPIDGSQCSDWGIYCTGTGAVTEAFSIQRYLWAGILVVFSFLSIVAAAALVYYGILYIISRGEEDKARQAKTGIVSALMGLLIAGLAAWIVNSIINL